MDVQYGLELDAPGAIALMIIPQYVSATVIVVLGLYLCYMPRVDSFAWPLGAISILGAAVLMALCMYQLWGMPLMWKKATSLMDEITSKPT